VVWLPSPHSVSCSKVQPELSPALFIVNATAGSALVQSGNVLKHCFPGSAGEPVPRVGPGTGRAWLDGGGPGRLVRAAWAAAPAWPMTADPASVVQPSATRPTARSAR
jgi:hypothetical protein